MNLDAWIKVITSLMPLLQILVWFLVIGAILFSFRKRINKFLDSLSELTLKVGVVEATARTQLQAAISLSAATAEQKVDMKAGGTPENAQEIERLVNQLVTPQTSRQLEGTLALWVDDNPSNNTYQRNALEALGIRFTICISTEDALKELRARNFNVIISDMVRQPDARAGYTLLEEVKKMHITTPFIICARGVNMPGNKEEARKRGAYEWVGGPQSLFEAVISVLLNKKKEETK